MWTYVTGVGWMHLLLTNSYSHTVSKGNVQLKVRIDNPEKGARGTLLMFVSPPVLSSSAALTFRPSFCLDAMTSIWLVIYKLDIITSRWL